jgi:general secretion pathway protein E
MRNLPAPRDVAARAIVSRIKILASLNIAERRLPQDGHFRATIRRRDFDIRVATMPTLAGEAAVLRLLDRNGTLVDFDRLGFSGRDGAVLEKMLAQPHGMLIVTGPTGSGKTTTLAASLSRLNDGSRTLLTIEDPIEYELDGVNQSQVRPGIGLTFATALRAFLRQDPDVIMVGEIRDPETARIALQASLTGHLVLTTLHTNTAAGAVTRLADIGIERYLIAATLTAVVAQRLFRSLCSECREPFTVTDTLREAQPKLTALGIKSGTTLFRARGCDRCGNSGYRGRQAIFEVLEVTEAVRREIVSGASEGAIENVARSEGMTTMVEDGATRCLSGLSSPDEIFRVAAFR